MAAPIFGEFMKRALADQPDVPFRTPSGIKLLRVNQTTGLPTRSFDRKSILEAFKAGNEPKGGAARVIGGSELLITNGGDGSGPKTIELGSGTGGLY